MAEISTTRRAFLAGVVAAAAGCSGLDRGEGQQPPTDTGTPNGTTETETSTDNTPTETSTPENHPGTFLVDFVPAVDEELRQQLHETVERVKNHDDGELKQNYIDAYAEWYLKTPEEISEEEARELAETQFNEIIQRAEPEFSEPEANELTESYSTDETYDDVKYDFSALEQVHDNDYFNLGITNFDMFGFVENLENQEMWAMVRQVANEFDFETFANSDRFIDAYAQIHPFLTSYESYTGGNSSAEDTEYAAMFQKAFDRYTDFETYFWDVETDGHGTGLVWNEQEDSIRMMESVNQNVPPDQWTALIENSVYTSGDGVPWHPVRFTEMYPDGSFQGSGAVPFNEGKSKTGGMLTHISVSEDDYSYINFDRIAFTTGYTLDIADSIRNYNSNNIHFSQLKRSANAYNKLARKAKAEDKLYVMGGTVEDPYAVQVESQEIVDAVENDQERRYDDMRKVAEEAENINGSVTLDDVNQILS